MSRTKCMVQQLLSLLHSRLDDTISFSCKRPNQNIINIIQSVNSRENQRLRDILKLQMKINDIVREETNQNITEIGKYLFGETLSLFQGICREFRVERQIKHDYNGLIYLFREYFIKGNDIRMVTKLEQLFKNKAIKKPVILTKLVKMLIDISRNFFLQHVKTVNQGITKYDLDQYNQQKNQEIKKNLPKILEASIKRNTLKVVCPIFVMDSVCRFEEEEDPINEKKKYGNLLFLRNKLKEKLMERTINKENIDEKYGGNKPLTRGDRNKRHFNSLIPLQASSYLSKLQNQQQIQYPQSHIQSQQIIKPLTTQIIRKRRNIGSRYSKDTGSKTLILNKPDERFRDFSGAAMYRVNYNILNLDQKVVTMIFLKKSRKYFSEIEYKELLNRNKEISRQILSFK